MTDDIVERLREWAQYPVGVRRSIDMLEAAAEIERLRRLTGNDWRAAIAGEQPVEPHCRCFPMEVSEYGLCLQHKTYLTCTDKGDEWPNSVKNYQRAIWRANNDHYANTPDSDKDWG